MTVFADSFKLPHELDNSSSTGLRLNYSTTRAL